MTPILFCSYTEMWFENRKLVLDLLGIGAIFLLVLDFLSVLNLLGKWCTSLLVLNLLVIWCNFLLVLNLLESGVFFIGARFHAFGASFDYSRVPLC